MSFLKKRRGAVVITTVFIVISILFGSHRSLISLRGAAENVFINGISGDGIGVASDLARRINSSQNLLTIAAKYITEEDRAVYDDVSLSVDCLIEAVQTRNSGSRDGMHMRNTELTAATGRLIQRLSEIELSQRDAEYCRSIGADLTSRNNTIMHDAYNMMAQEFNQRLDVFPANVLARLTSVGRLEVFR